MAVYINQTFKLLHNQQALNKKQIEAIVIYDYGFYLFRSTALIFSL